MKNRKAIIMVIVLLVGMFALVSCKSEPDHDDCDGHGNDEHSQIEEHDDHEDEQAIELSQEQIAELGIELATATGGEIDVYVNLPGEVAVNGDRMAHIVPRVSGVVGEVKKKLGDAVQAGEVMAVIRSRDLADAKAGYLAAIERYDLAKTIFEREDKLWKDKISSEQDYLDAKKGFAEAKIEMRSVEQKLHALGFSQKYLEMLPLEKESQLTRFEITAPFDGTVIDKHITLGEVVRDDAGVFVVADLSTVWIDLHVYPKDLMKIKKGQKVVMSANQTIPDAEGVISYVGPVVGAESRTALADIYEVHAVEILWERAHAKVFSIQVSLNGEDWLDVYSTDSGRRETRMMEFAPTKARWVRLFAKEPGWENARYTICGLKIFGK